MAETLERSIDIQAPASAAYNAWTRFEDFPKFMKGVEEVRQKDDTHLHWRANLWGRVEEWDAEITEQIPDKRIAWRTESGAENSGVVTFHRLTDDTSRVMLQLDYEPESATEKLGDAPGVLGRRVQGDLESFQDYVERHPDVQGWRGEVPAPPDQGQPRGA